MQRLTAALQRSFFERRHSISRVRLHVHVENQSDDSDEDAIAAAVQRAFATTASVTVYNIVDLRDNPVWMWPSKTLRPDV